MPENNLTQNNNLPEKSNLWIASNIAAGILLTNIAITFIGNVFLNYFSLEGFALALIYSIVTLLIGAYFGSKFGVQYVTKRSVINPDKINSISKIAVIIPFLFLLLAIIESIFMSGLSVVKIASFFIDFFVTLFVCITAYYFCKKFLHNFAGNSVQVKQEMLNAANKNETIIKILIVFIILIIVISDFISWKSYQTHFILPSPIVAPSATVTPNSLLITPAPTLITNNEIAGWKTFKSAYFGFEIKYPVDWVANENTQNISTVKDGDWWPVDTLPKNNAKISFEKTGTASIQEIINEKFGSASNNIITADDLIDINGLIKSRQVVYTCKNCQEKYISEINKNIPGAEGKIVLFEQGNNVLYLSLVYYKNDPRAAYFMDTFNQMVSTFEFGK